LTFLSADPKLRRNVPGGACIVTKLSPTTHDLEFQKWLQLVYENERRRLTERNGETVAARASRADSAHAAATEKLQGSLGRQK